jgi:hypothetical protein
MFLKLDLSLDPWIFVDQGFCVKNLTEIVWVKNKIGEMSQKGLRSAFISRAVWMGSRNCSLGCPDKAANGNSRVLVLARASKHLYESILSNLGVHRRVWIGLRT